MKTLRLSKSPSIYELFEILTQKFSNDYSYSLLSQGSERTILIRKNFLLQAQVSKKEDKIIVQAKMPVSIVNSLFSLLLYLIYATPGFINWILSCSKFEKKIALFILNKYE